jgi:hypothetical protein
MPLSACIGFSFLAGTARRALRSNLSDLPALFAEWMPDELRPRSVSHRRCRPFTQAVVFWLFLSQCLTRTQPCREAVRKLMAWLYLCRRPPISENTSAYCQARKNQIPEDFLKTIHQQIAWRVESKAPATYQWHGRRVGVVDGSTLSMPDTRLNQAAYPQPSEQKKGCGFPVMKIVGVFSLATGLLHLLAYGNLHDSERSLFRQLWSEISLRFDIILGDRGFTSFANMYLLKQHGVDTVLRRHQMRASDFRRGKRLGRHDHLVAWNKPIDRPNWLTPEEYAAMPAQWIVREVKVHVAVNGFRTRSYVLVTTLLDSVIFPPSALAALFFLRWSVELRFRDIKCTLGMDVLRCKSPAMVQKELWMQVLAHNLIRALMLKAAILKRRPLARLSFKGTVDTLRQWAPLLAIIAQSAALYSRLFQKFMACIAGDLVPLRPHRAEPRAKKRRPKNYQLLTKPRHRMGNLPHRNRSRRKLKKHD